MRIAHKLFDQMVDVENLMLAWHDFKRGKRQRQDVQYFERYVWDFIFSLHDIL
jgi:hypothetical protein